MSNSTRIPIDKTRISGSKVRTGCITCKARRIKCDEARPHCQRCVKAARICGGYIASGTAKRTPLDSKLRFVHYAIPDSGVSSRAGSPSPEVRALSHFATTTAHDLGRPFGFDLWSKSLMRMAEYEPAVRSGLIALSSFHELFLRSCSLDVDSVDPLNKLAWEHYGHMINDSKAMTERRSEDIPLAALVTCLLFCAIESLRGRFGPSLRFVNQGVSLLIGKSNIGQKQRATDLAAIIDIDELSPMFLNMSTQSLAISAEGRLEFASLQSDWATTAEGLTFRSSEHALAELSLLLNDIMQLTNTSEILHSRYQLPKPQLYHTLELWERHLDDWKVAYHNLLQRKRWSQQDYNSEQEEATGLMLRLHEVICDLYLEMGIEQPQGPRFDQYLSIFQEINVCASRFLDLERSHLRQTLSGEDRPYFGLTFGVVPSLYLVCSRCRDPKTRYEALRLLQSTTRRENLWDAKVTAKGAELYIRFEESLAKKYRARELGVHEDTVMISCAADIPANARVETTKSCFSDKDYGYLIFETGDRKVHDPVKITWDT